MKLKETNQHQFDFLDLICQTY